MAQSVHPLKSLPRREELGKIVALLTDFGERDPFAGIMKGVILKHCPQVFLVDLTHGISPHDILEGAFVLKTSACYFPEQTLFVGVVDPGVGSLRRIIYAETRRHSFLAPDNGLLGFVLEEEPPLKVIQVSNEKYFLHPVSRTFHGRDIFASVAGYLCKGVHPQSLGEEISAKSLVRLPFPQVRQVGDSAWQGEVVYVDRFGNLLTNFRTSKLELGEKEGVHLFIKDYVIKGLRENYSEGTEKPMALVGSLGTVEIAVKNGNASKLLSAGKGEKVKLECRMSSS